MQELLGAEVLRADPWHLDRLTVDQVLLDQLGDVGLGDAAVPDVVGHHQQGRTGQAALNAAGGHHLDVGKQPPPLLLAQGDGIPSTRRWPTTRLG